MKRQGNIYLKICSTENIKKAIYKASLGKRSQNRVKHILDNIDKYSAIISDMLKEKTFEPSDYVVMKILDGSNKKERVISKPAFFPDQIVHWALMLQIQPIIMKGMYYYNCGSVPGRGTSHGRKALRTWMNTDKRNTKYCLKMDVSKFYPSCDNDVLKSMFRRKIKDQDCLWLIDKIVDSADGLPIGNYTSQWFANFYLSGLDTYIKQRLGARYYIRYVDDLVILGPNKRKLHKIRKEIDSYLKDIKLNLKGNWQVFPTSKRFIDFLGLRFYPGKTTLRRRNALRIKRRVKKVYKKNRLTAKDASAIISYWGWIKMSDSYSYYNKYIMPYVSMKECRKVVSINAKRICIRTNTRV